MSKVYISGYISPESDISEPAVSLIRNHIDNGTGFIVTKRTNVKKAIESLFDRMNVANADYLPERFIGDTEPEIFRVEMADCLDFNRAIIFWDGKDVFTFYEVLYILCFSSMTRYIVVDLVIGDKVYDVRSPIDLKKLIPPRKNNSIPYNDAHEVPEGIIDSFCDHFCITEDIIKSGGIRAKEGDIVSVISDSNLSIPKQIEMLEYISKNSDIFHDLLDNSAKLYDLIRVFRSSAWLYCYDRKRALREFNELKPNEFIYVKADGKEFVFKGNRDQIVGRINLPADPVIIKKYGPVEGTEGFSEYRVTYEFNVVKGMLYEGVPIYYRCCDDRISNARYLMKTVEYNLHMICDED